MQLRSPVPASLFASYAEGITTPRRTTEGLKQMAELLGCELASLALWDSGLAWGTSHQACRQQGGWQLKLDDKILPTPATRQRVANMEKGKWQILEKFRQVEQQGAGSEQAAEAVLCMRLPGAKGAEAFLSLQKKDQNWRTASQTLRLADELVKPLSATLQAIVSLRQLSHRAAQMASVFDCIRMPLLLLDHSLRVLMANTAAQALISSKPPTEDASASPSGVAIPGVPADRLAPLVGRACGLAGSVAASVMQVKPTASQPALQIVVLPIVAKGALKSAQPVALVLVHGRPDAQDSAGLLLQHIYGLTPAEERLALMILHGESPGTAATRLQISLSTVRCQLSSVLQKTGAQRQADLVRRLSALLLVNQRPHAG